MALSEITRRRVARFSGIAPPVIADAEDDLTPQERVRKDTPVRAFKKASKERWRSAAMSAIQTGFAGFMKEYKDKQKTKAKKV